MYKRQQGVSLLGWIVVIFVLAVFGTAAIKLVPKYIENHTIHSILDRVAEHSAGKSKSQLRDEIRKNFGVSMIRSITAKDIQFEGVKGDYHSDASYEVRVPFLYNIDVVLKFNDGISETKK